MAAKLILIRHGQTDWNLAKRYCGFMDVDLNAQGRAQALAARKRLAGEVVHKVYTSDRIRAIHTAEIIFDGKPYEVVSDLREIHFGVLEGLTHNEIMERYASIYSQWLSDPYSVTIPEAEGLPDLKNRVVKVFEMIAAAHQGQTAAVVCHGGVISVFITHILKTNDFWKQIPGSASLSIVEYEGACSRIISLNDTLHLETGG